MAKDIKNESLIDALQYCELRKLPEIDNKEDFWIKALALVKKMDGTECFVCVEKDNNLENRIIKDFGTVSAIREIKEYYPYSFLKAMYLPKFKTPKKEERIEYLGKVGILCNDTMTLKELDKLVLITAVKRQKRGDAFKPSENSYVEYSPKEDKNDGRQKRTKKGTQRVEEEIGA